MTNKLLTVGTIVGVLVLVGMPAAASQTVVTTPLGCAGVVEGQGGYLLTQDTECLLSWQGDGGKTFDLGGHTLTGGMAIHGVRGRRTLRNGTFVTNQIGSNFWFGLPVSHVT